MWKWLNWAVRVMATALLLSFLSIWTTGYIVNSYVETLLKQLNLPLQTQPFALSGVWGKLWGASPAPQAEEHRAGDDAPASGAGTTTGERGGGQPAGNASEADSPDAGGAGVGVGTSAENGRDDGSIEAGAESESGPGGIGTSAENGSPDGPPSDTGLPPSAEEDAAPVFGQQGGASAATEAQQQALHAIMSKLNEEQLQELSGYLSDGLTDDEWVAVQELLKPVLTDAEFARMAEALAPRRLP